VIPAFFFKETREAGEAGEAGEEEEDLIKNFIGRSRRANTGDMGYKCPRT
jgi:4-hydroxy-L-threonine phosphate dehydrogenase PdxA